MDSYALHQAVMAKLEDKNNTSEKADRLLRTKYVKDLERFGTMDESGFQKAWANGEVCPDFDTCSKRILIVGGLIKLKEMYRKIVESNGGVFDYHTGRIRNGKNNLEARVKRSDMVICPVNHNSHNACLKVKQFCNKHNKDMHMIPGSSLTAISTVFAASGLAGSHEPCSLN